MYWHHWIGPYLCYHSVTMSCSTLRDLMGCSTPGFPVLHYLLEFAQNHVHWSGIPSNYLILCCLLLPLPSIFASIRVFPSESALRIRWPKYWSFSFSISPTNEYSGLISFRIDWFDLLAVQGTHKSLLQHHSSKASIFCHSAFFMVQLGLVKHLQAFPSFSWSNFYLIIFSRTCWGWNI